MHHIGVRNIAISEDDLRNSLRLDQGFEPLFRVDRNAVRVRLTGKLRRLGSIFNVRDLGSGEGHNFVGRIGSKIHVEIVKISPCSSHY